MPAFPHLLAPGRIGGLTLPHRILFPPMSTRLSGPDGLLGSQEIAFLAARARGGAALVLSGPMLVSTELEPSTGQLLRVDDDAAAAPVARLASAVHAAGSLLGVQLSPGTGRLGPAAPGEPAPVSASPSRWARDPAVACRELTVDEIALLVRRTGEAAARLAAAGVDLIDLHGHAGFLVDQFLTAAWNTRTDGYGGSVAGRTRFLLELVAAVRAAAPEVALSVRLTVAHRVPGGREVAESVEVARLLEDAGVDLLLVEEGAPLAPGAIAPPHYLGEGLHVAGAVAVAQAVRVPVAVGGSVPPELAEKLLADGDVAFVAMGRALVADPDLPRHLAAGRAAAVRPCTRCNRCFDQVRAGQALTCAVNPLAGLETSRAVPRADVPHRVVVVGGGPAGLEAARVASLRGHAVDLYERSDRLGGVLARAADPAVKPELGALVDWWAGRLAAQGVTVHLGRGLDRGSPVLARADAVVVATGGVPVHPVDLVGLGRDDVVDALDLASRPVGHRVVVAGGGSAGADAALGLALRGHDVTLLEAQDVLVPGELGVNRGVLLARLQEAGVTTLPGHRVVRRDDAGVHALTAAGPVVLPADTLVVALGVRADGELAGSGVVEDRRVQVVGDCAAPGTVAHAVATGFAAGLRV